MLARQYHDTQVFGFVFPVISFITQNAYRGFHEKGTTATCALRDR